MTNYKVVFRDKDRIIFDTLELTPEQVEKFKEDPNLLNIEEVNPEDGIQ